MEMMDVADACQFRRNDLMFYEDRVASFKFWPVQLKPGKFRLARGGFYYTGQYDKVSCFCCDLTLYDWEQKDDPFEEHRRLSPSCGFVKMVGNGQVDNQFDDGKRNYQTFERKSNASGFGFGASIPSNVFVKQTPPSSFGNFGSK